MQLKKFRLFFHRSSNCPPRPHGPAFFPDANAGSYPHFGYLCKNIRFMKKSYRVLQISIWRCYAAALLTICFIFFIFILLFNILPTFPFFFLIIPLLCAFLVHIVLVRHIATAELVITMDENGVHFQCIKPLWLQKNVWEQKFSWEEMKDYSFGFLFFFQESSYDRLLLRLENNGKFILYPLNSMILYCDDYKTFKADFIECFKKYHA